MGIRCTYPTDSCETLKRYADVDASVILFLAGLSIKKIGAGIYL